jgi:hypothetical protein
MTALTPAQPVIHGRHRLQLAAALAVGIGIGSFAGVRLATGPAADPASPRAVQAPAAQAPAAQAAAPHAPHPVTTSASEEYRAPYGAQETPAVPYKAGGSDPRPYNHQE